MAVRKLPKMDHDNTTMRAVALLEAEEMPQELAETVEKLLYDLAKSQDESSKLDAEREKAHNGFKARTKMLSEEQAAINVRLQAIMPANPISPQHVG